MQAMGYIPMMLHPNPKNALVMCFGTGNTLGTVARFPGVQAEGVEIDRNVLSLAHRFSKWNGDVLNRPNVTIKIQDGRNHIRWTQNKYDVITLEPMHPAHAGVNSLYSREFYEEARLKLSPGGIMMQWLPLHLLNSKDSLAILNTFQQVFPNTTIWNSYLTRIVLLVGSMEPLQLSPQTLLKNKPPMKSLFWDRKSACEPSMISWIFIWQTRSNYRAYCNRQMGSPTTGLFWNTPPSTCCLLPRQTDETFLNMLRARLDNSPPLKAASSEQAQQMKERFQLRTAQRLSIFSQRYRGPGASAFEEKDFLKGLEAVKQFNANHKEPWIAVSDSGWQAGPMPGETN